MNTLALPGPDPGWLLMARAPIDALGLNVPAPTSARTLAQINALRR